MYLVNCFANTKEFKDFNLEDWKTNSKWFNIKLLVDASHPDGNNKVLMKNNTYMKAIKQVLGSLGIKSSHWLHLC